MRKLTNLLVGVLTGALVALLIYLLLRPRWGEEFRLAIATRRDKKDPGLGPITKEDDLEVIYGIGPAYAHRLHAAGIVTYADLAAASPFRLAEIAGPRVRLSDIASWIEEARGLIAAA